MSRIVKQSVQTFAPIGRYADERSVWPSKWWIILGLICILWFIYGGLYATLSEYGLEEYTNLSFTVALFIVILTYRKLDPDKGKQD